MTSLAQVRRALIFSAAFTLLVPPTAATTQSYAVARDKYLRGSVERSSAPDSLDSFGPELESADRRNDSTSSKDDHQSTAGTPGANDNLERLLKADREEVRLAEGVSAADAAAAEALVAYEEARRELASQKIEQEEIRIRALEARQQEREARREQAELDSGAAAADAELRSAETALKEAQQQQQQQQEEGEKKQQQQQRADTTVNVTFAVEQARNRKAKAAKDRSAAIAEARGNMPYLLEMETNARDFEVAFVRATKEAGLAAERVKQLKTEMVERMEEAAEAQAAWQAVVESRDSQSHLVVTAA